MKAFRILACFALSGCATMARYDADVADAFKSGQNVGKLECQVDALSYENRILNNRIDDFKFYSREKENPFKEAAEKAANK